MTDVAVPFVVGTTASTVAVLSPFQEVFEYGVRITGGLLGLLLVALSIWSVWLTVKAKRRAAERTPVDPEQFID